MPCIGAEAPFISGGNVRGCSATMAGPLPNPPKAGPGSWPFVGVVAMGWCSKTDPGREGL